MDRYGGRGVSRATLPLMALHVANEYYRLGRKPPVTAGLILVNTLLYLRPGALHRVLPTIDQVLFNPHLILKESRSGKFHQCRSNFNNLNYYGDLKRFLLSAFYHMNESHLVYNMMSLLWKGIQLETTMGSLDFASMIAALLGLSQGITILLAKSLLIFFDYKTAYYHQYAAGFSGVLFGMKVVLNAQSEEFSHVYGMVVPARYSAWAELILIQLFVPGVSFLGHLGGILAGLAYLKLRGSLSSPDPLSLLIRKALGLLSWPLKLFRGLSRFRSRRIGGRGRVGRSPPPERGTAVRWSCPVCTYDNSAWSDACEMCSAVRRDQDFRPTLSDRSRDLSMEEVRQRRLERFDR